jgi:hypothetical protein
MDSRCEISSGKKLGVRGENNKKRDERTKRKISAEREKKQKQQI